MQLSDGNTVSQGQRHRLGKDPGPGDIRAGSGQPTVLTSSTCLVTCSEEPMNGMAGQDRHCFLFSCVCFGGFMRNMLVFFFCPNYTLPFTHF